MPDCSELDVTAGRKAAAAHKQSLPSGARKAPDVGRSAVPREKAASRAVVPTAPPVPRQLAGPERRIADALGQLRASLHSYENLMALCYGFYESFSRSDSTLLAPEELHGLHQQALKRLERALLTKKDRP